MRVKENKVEFLKDYYIVRVLKSRGWEGLKQSMHIKIRNTDKILVQKSKTKRSVRRFISG
jgi:hypothetical protein